MSNSIAPGSSADVNVRVTALTTNPNVPSQYKTIILKKNLVNGVNTLTQEMMSAQNTKYVIKYDYTLGENITVPTDCVLEFDGGSIGGAYTITGTNTKIFSPSTLIFKKDVLFAGTFGNRFVLEWFKEDNEHDDVAINRVISKLSVFTYSILLFTKDKYELYNTVTLNTGRVSYEINSTFDCNNLIDEVAVNVITTGGVTENNFDVGNKKYISGLRIHRNPENRLKTALNISGYLIAFHNLAIVNFDKGIVIDNNCYLNSFYSLKIGRCTTCIYSVKGTNKGENNSFYGSVLSNSDLGIYCEYGNLNFYGSSIDYVNRFIYCAQDGSSVLSFIGCHLESFNENNMHTFEDTNDAPIVLLGSYYTRLAFIDCEFLSMRRYEQQWANIDYFMFNDNTKSPIIINNCRFHNIYVKYLCGGSGSVDIKGTLADTENFVFPLTVSENNNILYNNGINENYVVGDDVSVSITDNIMTLTKSKVNEHFYLFIPIDYGYNFFTFYLKASADRTVWLVPKFVQKIQNENLVIGTAKYAITITDDGENVYRFQSNPIPKNANGILLDINTGPNPIGRYLKIHYMNICLC